MTTRVTSFRQAGLVVNRHTAAFAKGIEPGASKIGAQEAAIVIKKSVSGFLGGPVINLSGVGKKGARVGVKSKTYSANGQQYAVVDMFGPAQLVERDTSAHTIISKKVGKLGKGKGSRSKAAKHKAKQDLYNALFGGSGGGRLKIGDNVRTGPFQHPGTKGKHPFEKGVQAGRKQTVQAYRREVRKAAVAAFKG